MNPRNETSRTTGTWDDESPAAGMNSEQDQDAGFAEYFEQAQQKMQSLAKIVTEQAQQHPVRTLAFIGAAGFVVAVAARSGALSSLVRGGLGVVAAVALRRFVEAGLAHTGVSLTDSGLGVGT